MLEENYDEFSEEEKFSILKEMKTALTRTYNMLNNLLTWACSQLGRIQFSKDYYDLDELTKMTIYQLNSITKSKSIKLLSQVKPNSNIYCDKDMILIVLRNLITNAIKFSYEGGKISISYSIVENILENYDRSVIKNGKYSKISIQDFGIGINQEDIEKLFRIDSTYSNIGTFNEQGSGLGLILCKDFIEKHKGNIWIESELGKGTTVHFTLPLNN